MGLSANIRSFVTRPSVRSSLLSGLFGGLAGFVTKATFDQNVLQETSSFLQRLLPLSYGHGVVSVVPQGVGVILMILCNVCMLAHFNKALQSTGATVEVTVLTAAANIIVTAILGNVLYSEAVSLRWWIGTLLILAGIVCLATEGEKPKKFA